MRSMGLNLAGCGKVCGSEGSEMRTAKSSTESQKANFFCDGGWPISERDALSVTGTASAGAFLYDVYVIQLLCRESNWCDTVHSAVLALLLKEKLCKAKSPLAGGKHYHSIDLPVDAGIGGWPGLETHPCLALESCWFVERWAGSH